MTKLNWKLRLRNKATLAALIAASVAFIYQILGIVGVTPAIAQNDAIQLLGIVINLLAALGIVTDPTTEGTGDSTQALGYDYPSPTAPTESAKED